MQLFARYIFFFFSMYLPLAGLPQSSSEGSASLEVWWKGNMATEVTLGDTEGGIAVNNRRDKFGNGSNGEQTRADEKQFYEETFSDSDQISDKGWIKGIIRVLVAGGTLALAFAGVFLYQRQLQKAVIKRTVTIESAKKEIKEKNDRLRAQKEELESLNHFKDRILLIVSHDVRSPLNSIQGMVDLAASGRIPAEEFIAFAKHSRTRMQEVNSFLENILFWAKNQLHGVKLNIEPVNLSEITQNTISLLALNARKKSIEITDNIPADLSVLVDKESTKLVIRNLVSNAVKFCDSGDRIILNAASEHGQVRVTVEDTGQGIPPERLTTMFESDKISTDGSNGETGTGLGLLLCKEFVEKNGGEIGVESDVGKGSQFWFTVNSVAN